VKRSKVFKQCVVITETNLLFRKGQILNIIEEGETTYKVKATFDNAPTVTIPKEHISIN
jgi:hypothetical protein